MAGFVKYEKQEDGTVLRVPVSNEELIASKEAALLAMYEELKSLKGE